MCRFVLSILKMLNYTSTNSKNHLIFSKIRNKFPACLHLILHKWFYWSYIFMDFSLYNCKLRKSPHCQLKSTHNISKRCREVKQDSKNIPTKFSNNFSIFSSSINKYWTIHLQLIISWFFGIFFFLFALIWKEMHPFWWYLFLN